MPLAGATAPNSPAGTALIANAEFLSSLVLYQCLKPGASLIYGIGSSTMDMRTGAFEYGPDAQLSTLMLAGMAHRYNLPLNTAGLGTGAKHLGPQCGWETLANATLSVLAGSDEAYGLGQFDDAKVLSLEKLVYDAEQARQLKRLSRGVDFDHKRLLADVIARVGFDDHYLRQPETRDLMRSEIEIPKLDDDRTQAEWLAAGRDEQARLSQVVEALLASHQPPPLPEGAQYKMDRILEEAAHTFAGEAAS
jgi:trimethylamine--corrinoid protein Co-methyltransferase